MVTRLAGGNDDRASRGVATIYGALRSLQHFDLLHGALILVKRRGVGFKNAVNHQSNVVFSIARAVQTANIDLGVTSFCSAGHNAHARGEFDEIAGRFHPGLFKRRRGEHGHRSRDILKLFVLAACRNNDISRRNPYFLRILSKRRTGRIADACD